MPRRPRIVVPNALHHVTQRGNNRMQMFFDDEDRGYFLTDLRYYAEKYRLQIAAYCLMSNHTHIAVVPSATSSLSSVFKPLHMRYSQYLNRKFMRSGVNWQGRFYSAPVDEEHAFAVFQYIYLNPVRVGLVNKPEDYKWSSAAVHLGLQACRYLNANSDWLQVASEALSDISKNPNDDLRIEKFKSIERGLKGNLPLATGSFISKLEKMTGRELRFRGRGRPTGIKINGSVS